ncbi:MAG TPA: hypothetical protein VGB08_09760 [Allosphingosinicella sp.]
MAARPIASRGATPIGAAERTKPTVNAPAVWPASLAVPCSPPAAALRLSGAVRNMVRLFGTWNRPKPVPQIAAQTANGATLRPIGHKDIAASPPARRMAPAAQSGPEATRSANRLATRLVAATATGHSVRTRAIVAALRPSESCR